MNQVDAIYTRHMDAMQVVSDTFKRLDGSVYGFSMRLALQELAVAMQQDNADADDQLARIERVLEYYDSALFADVANGRTGLATAIDALITNERRGALLGLTSDLRNCQAVATSQRAEIARLDSERNSLESQILQLDADNARLTQELATVRSWVMTPHGNGKSSIASVEAQMLAALDAAEDRRIRDDLSTIANDYYIGLDAGRWTWRDVPKSVRLELVRFVIAGCERHTQSEFDANRPDWMATASSHVQTFGVPWAHLSDFTREVAA